MNKAYINSMTLLVLKAKMKAAEKKKKRRGAKMISTLLSAKASKEIISQA